MFLIIKNTFRIRIHVFFYIFMFICFITGNIRDYLIFTSIIIVHEFGHILGGIIFSWRINEVVILPFGGLTIFNCFVNTSLFEQFIVTFLGPLFQILYFLVLNYFFYLSDRIIFYNYSLLFFNLLPIFPLDGSKFLYIFLCIFFPFRYVLYFLLYVSFCFILFVFLFVGRFDLIVFLILFFLIVKCINEFLNIPFIFNKFLFERYTNDFKFRLVKRVNSINKMFIWCGHVFFNNDGFISEKKKLLKMFDKRYKLW